MAGGRAGAPDLQYKDYYAVLGVPKTASQAEIKKAFRKLARQHHPDANPGDAVAERKFKEINEANEVLADPDKRKKYDALGADWAAYDRAGATRPGGAAGDPFAPGGPFAGYAQSAGGGNVRYEFRTSGAGGDGFSDFFQMFFGADGPTTLDRSLRRSASRLPPDRRRHVRGHPHRDGSRGRDRGRRHHRPTGQPDRTGPETRPRGDRRDHPR